MSAFAEMLAAQKDKPAVEAASVRTLGEALSTGSLLEAIRETAGRASESDAAQAARATCVAVQEAISGHVASLALIVPGVKSARKPVVKPEDVRLSTYDGRKVYAYVTVRADGGPSISIGANLDGILGAVLAPSATRKTRKAR